MSEDITIGTGTETILGSFAEAQGYIGLAFGDRYDTWSAITDPNKQKKSLVNAVRYLNEFPWNLDADTFAKRDAIPEFAKAQYELAVLVVEDPEVTDEADQGSNIASLRAGSAGIDFFNATTQGADPMHAVLMRLVGKYLAATTGKGPQGGGGQSGSCHNPFSDCADSDRRNPW